jgi:hypothetical protein
MINWLNVLYNAILILGAALALAVLSIAYYQAQAKGSGIMVILSLPGSALALNISGALFCLGLALASEKWWEIALWALLVFGFLYQIYLINKQSKI